MALRHLSTGTHALHRGAYELALATPEGERIPQHIAVQVSFTRPDGTQVAVDAYYDGQGTYKARAYCDMPGVWRWQSHVGLAALPKSGSFEVVPSSLPGKLRVHPEDPYQFAYDSGAWFLHVGDTGYRYLAATEPEWRAYIDQSARMGATKVRAWFCQGRGDVQALFDRARAGWDLPYWREIDRRLVYALERHPGVQFELIPYGEDTAELHRYEAGDPLAVGIARYAQARFSALPNVHWCISNDREIVLDDVQPLAGRQVYARTIDRIGRDMAAREPWGTLLTNHQCRWSGYAFVDAPWSDIITLEDIDQVDGAILLDYRRRGAAPVVNDEDRYETYRPPRHPRSYFRRLIWASLLSGGHATYGGLATYEPYDRASRGVQGYYDAVAAGKLEGGARDFVHIHRFFADTGLTLVGMMPDDALVGGDPRRAKCIHGDETVIVYLANPSGDEPETDRAAAGMPSVSLHLPRGPVASRWYDPQRGEWTPAGALRGGPQTLTAPGGGDWVLLIGRASR